MDAAQAIADILLWGVLATLAMVAILYTCQQWGWSRLSLPFLLGTLVTGDRHVANVLGFVLYLLGGVALAFFYFLMFVSLGHAGGWVGAGAGLVHGLLLLTAVLPMLPYVHPRVASEYDGASTRKRLEPPGFMARHYGWPTPLVTLAAHAAYGAVLGLGLAPGLA